VLFARSKGALTMTDASETALETARRRVRKIEEKLGRQQKRYAMQAVEGDASAKPARALMEEIEAELEAGREALRKLEETSQG
jgi:hypothetical protein